MLTKRRNLGQTARLYGRVSPALVDLIREESARLGISQSDYVEMCIRNAKADRSYWLSWCTCGYSEPWDDAEFLKTRYHLSEGGRCPRCGRGNWLETALIK